MKRFISFILLAIMFITSCGISQSAEENDDKKVVIAAFEDYINAAKNEDTKKVSEYHLMWFNIWRTSQESYKYLTYKINKIELTKQKNGNGRDIKLAYVNVSLKYPDLNYTMSKFYKNKDFNSLVRGKSRSTQLEIIEQEISSFLKNELKKNDTKYIEKEMIVKFEYFYPLKKWKIPYDENIEFINILSLDSYKIKGMDKTIGEIVRTPENDDDRKLLISEKEEKIKNKTAKIDDYKLLLILYSPVKNPDNINFKRISQKLIENFPDYPEGYRIMTDFLYHSYPDNYSEILNYAQKGIEAYKNVDTKKYPEFVYEKNEKALSEIMKKEILEGIDGTGIKAGIIGEIGSSKDKITETELKVFKSAIIAHLETGIPITTHTSLGTMGHEQVKLFKEYKVNPDKIVIGHVDLSGNTEYILKMLYDGVYVEFDTIGKNNYLLDDIRVEMLKEIEKRELIDRVFLSMDITRKSNMKYNGGIGYNYIFEVFLPKLKEAGIKESSIEKMLKTNSENFYK